MTTFTVSLPDPLGDFVNEQVAQGGYASASEYFGNVVRQALIEAERAQLRGWLEGLSPAAQQRLDEMLLAGLNSGEPIPADDAFWQELIDEHVAEHSGRPTP